LLRIDIIQKIQVLKSRLDEIGTYERETAKFRLSVSKQTSISQSDFDKLRQTQIAQSIEKNTIIHELRSLELCLLVIDSKESPAFDRIIVGGGIAATLVFMEVGFASRNLRSSSGLPKVLVLNNPVAPNTWPKEDARLMGQPARIQTPQVLSSHSEDFTLEGNDKKNDNPYQYVVAKDFTHAMTETQNDLQMSILNLAAVRIESSISYDDQNGAWEHAHCKHRIAVQIDTATYKYLYTNAIDLCIGLGDPIRLSDNQIQPDLAKKLMQQNKLIYAQDGNAELAGEVVFIGTSAINAAWIAEIDICGSQPKARIKQWVGVDGQGFFNVKALNRLIHTAVDNNKTTLGLGTLISVQESSDGRLELTFAAPNNHIGNFTDLTGKTIICDQLVYSSGQLPHTLTKDLQGFTSCAYEHPSRTNSSTDFIPLGTMSKDGSIIAWGAAGTLGIGLPAQEAKQHFQLALRHSKTLAHETRAPGGIYRSSWSIRQLASQLREQRFLPPVPVKSDADPHKCDLPDINLATHEELMDVISTTEGQINPTLCETYAKIIEGARSINQEPTIRTPGGIHDISQLKDVLPVNVLIAIQHYYFPFSKPVEGVTDQKAIARTKPYQPLSWLSQRRVPDSTLQVSDIKYTNNQSSGGVNPGRDRTTVPVFV